MVYNIDIQIQHIYITKKTESLSESIYIKENKKNIKYTPHIVRLKEGTSHVEGGNVVTYRGCGNSHLFI